jgi:predicted 3-demethylubiquinone-9 3-methyltransferase (glyoxalase superfamily)
MPRIIPNLWFDSQALEAAEFYVSIFPNSSITDVTHYTQAGPGEPGTVLTVEFELDGQAFTALNGGPRFTFDEAISFAVEVQDQAELDRYWDALLEGGGEESQCGWLKDRFGLSWQVVPAFWIERMKTATPEQADRAMSAMLQMVRFDIAIWEGAFDG